DGADRQRSQRGARTVLGGCRWATSDHWRPGSEGVTAMRDILILTEKDLRAQVHLDIAAIDVVEQAFRTLASGTVIMPPILSMDLPAVHAEVDVKTAYIPGFDGFAIKVSPGFFDNPKIGLPSLNGLMILFNTKTGLVDALLLDNGYLTEVRTAAAGAVA